MKFILSLYSFLATPLLADPVVVFAAASLKGPLDAFAVQSGNVVVSYGGSGALARQITQGAPADVVLLANDAWMQTLVAADLVYDVADFASNTLVVIGPTDAPEIDLAHLPDLLGDGKLAMGFTGAVPVGIYGRAALEALNIWDDLTENVVELDNVRAALTLVSRGEAAFGITYATDAQITDTVRIVARIAPTLHAPIRYTGGLVSDDPDAMTFWSDLQGDAGQNYLQDAGFLAPVSE